MLSQNHFHRKELADFSSICMRSVQSGLSYESEKQKHDFVSWVKCIKILQSDVCSNESRFLKSTECLLTCTILPPLPLTCPLHILPYKTTKHKACGTLVHFSVHFGTDQNMNVVFRNSQIPEAVIKWLVGFVVLFTWSAFSRQFSLGKVLAVFTSWKFNVFLENHFHLS